MDNRRAKTIRAAAGLTQTWVARRIGVHTSQVCAFERYGVPLPAKAAAKLRRLLKAHESALAELMAQQDTTGEQG